jgi:hypothetical protein
MNIKELIINKKRVFKIQHFIKICFMLTNNFKNGCKINKSNLSNILKLDVMVTFDLV